MTFTARVLITAATIVGAWTRLAPTEPRTVQLNTTPEPTAAAVATIEQQTADLTEGPTCWDDPTGHQPTLAVVKDDGGTTAYTLTADDAWDAAHAGDVWVLAWCEGGTR